MKWFPHLVAALDYLEIWSLWAKISLWLIYTVMDIRAPSKHEKKYPHFSIRSHFKSDFVIRKGNNAPENFLLTGNGEPQVFLFLICSITGGRGTFTTFTITCIQCSEWSPHLQCRMIKDCLAADNDSTFLNEAGIPIPPSAKKVQELVEWRDHVPAWILMLMSLLNQASHTKSNTLDSVVWKESDNVVVCLRREWSGKNWWKSDCQPSTTRKKVGWEGDCCLLIQGVLSSPRPAMFHQCERRVPLEKWAFFDQFWETNDTKSWTTS